MARSKSQKGTARRRPARRRGKKRRLRLRRYAGLGVALAVLATAVLIHLYVSVTARFDGTLWTLPSQIYSDRLLLERGVALGADDLEGRLDRSGYAQIDGSPGKPGQYRRTGERFAIHLRAFSTPAGVAPARFVEVRLRRGRIVSLADGRGRRIDGAELEPELLATVYGSRHEERDPLGLEEIPEELIAAVLAAEDSRFYTHHGLDLRGIARAGWTNVKHGGIVQGGSTITQQTVKNLFLDQRRTWWRKLREAAMAVMLDAAYSKPRILEVYLNEVYLGQRGPVAICGVQSAARFYFGRDLADLTLGEWATLAGMISSPGRYNPFVHPEQAQARRDLVLEALERLGQASAEDVEAARGEALHLASGKGGFDGGAPYVVDFVRTRLSRDYPPRVLRDEGLRIYTTLDTSAQKAARQALRGGLERLERDVATVRDQREERTLQGATLVTRPSDGAILAMVGGRDYRQSQFNRVVQARRQPGSCFKPFVYAAGFERALEQGDHGLTPATLIDDSPIELKSGGKRWSPSNYDHEFRGIVTARHALESSLNVPTVRAAQHVGIDRVIDTAARCGISTPLSEVPSLALGTGEVTPLELAEAYGTISQGGMRHGPWIIRGVVDREGNTLARAERRPVRAIAPEAAYLVHDILEGVFERGTARSAARLGFRGRAAGKTGTTDDTRDSWFVGYSGDRLSLVWVGYDDNARTGLTGASGALPVWVELMNEIGPAGNRNGPRRPRDVVRLWVDPQTGYPASPRCPEVVAENFIAGTEPEGQCPVHHGRLKRWWRNLMDDDRDRKRPGSREPI